MEATEDTTSTETTSKTVETPEIQEEIAHASTALKVLGIV